MMDVDKPVLYVHANAAMPVTIGVIPGPGLRIAEHFPLTRLDPISWRLDVAPGACTTPRAYPTTCDAPDGYCETAELALYETSDASCLTHEGVSLPLLFYRMRADTPPVMPLDAHREGDEVVVHNKLGHDGIGAVWRVRWDGASGVTHATRVPVPPRGATLRIPLPTSSGVEGARAALRADLAAHGLSAPESDAFTRAWDTALFGRASSVDGDRTDRPVRPNDIIATDELSADDIPAMAGGPRIADAILYWLPADAIEGLARLEASPAPEHLRRAILVRADVR
jgi:hypothetical protein